MRRRALQLVAPVAALLAWPCHAWGPDGHRIIGAIASRHLADETRSRVRELLGEQTLADACNWADEIRGNPDYDWAKPLHYVNLPKRDDSKYLARRDCRNGQCVVGAIEHYGNVLRDPSASRDQRVEALKFLAHFVGDVHQPMHVSYEEDLGGNRVNIHFFGKRTNLHRLWDSGLLRRDMPGGWSEHAVRIDNSITDEQATALVAQMDPGEWANESFAITRTLAYNFPPDHRLGEAYYRRTIGPVNQRLGEAGIRLASLLDDILATSSEVDRPDDPAPPPAPPPGGDPPVSEAAAALEVVLGEACGRAGGREVFVVNHDPNRIVRAMIEKSWTFNGEPRVQRAALVIRPGEPQRKRLGCSRTGRGPGEFREFTWTVIEAEFR